MFTFPYRITPTSKPEIYNLSMTKEGYAKLTAYSLAPLAIGVVSLWFIEAWMLREQRKLEEQQTESTD